MEKIIEPVAVDLLKSELTPERFFRKTNKGGNEIYIVDAHNSPNVMQEIGRIREVSFREAGGSSGLSADIDSFDTMPVPYSQMIVWDPDAQAILGGYRFILGPDIQIGPDGQPLLATAHMFRFSKKFIDNYLPHVIELGRSFVAPEYQSSKAGAKALFALDNLWDGIGSICDDHPQILYMFGKMTMYPSYDHISRDLILHFLWKHFPEPEELVRPIEAVMPDTDPAVLDLILKDEDFKTDYRNLKDAIRRRGTNIPPLVNSYMNTSPCMKMLGTAVNREFSDVEETGILVSFNEMYPEKRDRHVLSRLDELKEAVRKRFPRISLASLDRLHIRRQEHRDEVFKRFNRKNKEEE